MIKTLKASAGTGKTYRLSLEYAANLLKGYNFENIVVMTFTRKATAEIRERIFAHIEDMIENGRKSEVYQNLLDIYPLIELDQTLLNKAYQKMLCNKDKINIYTIDSFINTIFKRAVAPYQGIYNYEIIEDDDNKEIIEQVFKRILDNKEDFALMESFLSSTADRSVDKYISFLKEMINNRWIFLLIAEKERVKIDHPEISKLLDDTIYYLEKIAEEKRKDIFAFLIKDYQDFIPKYFSLINRSQKQKMIIKNKDLFFTNSFWHGNKVRGKAVAELCLEMKKSYGEFKEALAAFIFNEEMIPYEKEIFNFYNRIFAIYDDIKFKEKKFTHLDISNYTYKYFCVKELGLIESKQLNNDKKENDSNKEKVSNYFYELIGSKVENLFIDEFQDTSILQWKILLPIIRKTKNLITVGDEKQSIYGWRGGEKELFGNLENIIGGDSESLATCYRSEKEVLDFINKFFLNLDQKWTYNQVNHLPKKNGGYVKVLLGGDKCLKNTETKTFKNMSVEKQEAYQKLNKNVVRNLKEELANNIAAIVSKSGDIVVLARKANELDAIAYELDRRGIPYIYESKNSLLDHEAIKPIYSLLNFLTYEDYFHLIRFMRSDLIGINSDEMKIMLEQRTLVEKYLKKVRKLLYSRDFNSKKILKDLYFNTRSKNEGVNQYNIFQDGLAIDFTKFIKIDQYKRAEKIKVGYIERILQTTVLLSDLDYNLLSEILIKILGITDIYQQNSGALKNVYKFFSIMKEYSSLSEFMEYLAENRDSDDLNQAEVKAENAVKLMTIHKAKGLSFATEFFYWDPGSRKGGPDGNLRLYVYFDEKYENITDYLLTTSRYEKYFDYLGLNFAKKEQRKELMEEINNVYVALTRPKENLFFYIEGPRQLEVGTDKLCWSDNERYGFYENALLTATESVSLSELVLGKEFGSLDTDLRTFENSEAEEINRPKNGSTEVAAAKTSAESEEQEQMINLRSYFTVAQPSREKITEVNEKKNYDIKVSRERNKVEGLAVHYYLEHISYDRPGEREYAEKMVRGRYGNIVGPKNIEKVIKRVEKFIDKNPQLFSNQWEVFNEYKINDGEEFFRIDRLLLDREKSKIIILDFKTGVTMEKEQLNNYRKVVAKNLSKNGFNNYSIITKFVMI